MYTGLRFTLTKDIVFFFDSYALVPTQENVRKHKLPLLGLMENVGLYMQPILAEQERMHKAIESLQDSNNKHME